MMLVPRRWRIAPLAVLAGIVFGACAPLPEDTQPRTAFPGAEPAVSRGEGEAGERDGEAPPALLDDSLFAATRDAIAAGDWMAAYLALPRPARNPAGSDAATRPSEGDLDDPHSGSADPGDGRARDIEAPESDVSGVSNVSGVSGVSGRRAEKGQGGERGESRLAGSTELWIRYYSARIALLRGDLEEHGRLLADLASLSLPTDLERELLWHRLQLAELQGDALTQVRLERRLDLVGGHPQRDAGTAAASLWQAVQLLSARERETLRGSGDAVLQGWLDLGDAQLLDDAGVATYALDEWLRRYADHPALSRAVAMRAAALRDAATTRLTLLLPLSGPLQAAGDAVSRGFIAAYYANHSANVRIDVVDSQRYDTIDAAHAAALGRDPDIVIGPLGKLQVEKLLAVPQRPVPLLALNRPARETARDGRSLLLSLAPEDEARQLAERAFAEGARRALLIRPQGEWGARMERALRERWEQLGGQLPALAEYSDAASQSSAIGEALGLADGAQRTRELRSLFTESVESSGRRREDLDSIFMLSRGSDEARALKPMIDFQYAGDLPVYALSTADSGNDNAALNRDLNGVRLLAMPWRLASEPLPGTGEQDSGDSFLALHALGADAYALARRWWRTGSAGAAVYRGLTAELRPGADGDLERRLRMAEFDRGVLRPR